MSEQKPKSIFDEVFYYTTRFKTTLARTDHDGKKVFKDIFGSGVWLGAQEYLKNGGRYLFYVTNRHLVDYDYNPSYKISGFESIENIDIELRRFDGNEPKKETEFFDLVSVQKKIFFPKDGSDLAIIAISCYLTKLKEAEKKGFRPLALAMDTFLAQESYFLNELMAIDSATFVGFPAGIYDEVNNLPIARNANISSNPKTRFKNDLIDGDLVLVSGLSFGGSSGSPVYSLPVGSKALGVGRVLSPKFIGVISGHLQDSIGHKGLSYFVKSTKILEVLNENKLLEIAPPPRMPF